MRQWLVDTNVLLDVIGADTVFGERSKAVLSRCAEQGVLVVNPVILAEVAALLDSLEELEALLPEALFRRDPIPLAASFLAGQAYRRYKRQGGAKSRMLADFLIGAHAAVTGLDLISRDEGYSAYFTLTVLNPARG
ncbi:MAG: type II toxin-antitoxin system VapC family toxin [Truepera sp.]|nr:type II toxin-antitoxin system VapC family toxin [Truepera sp.]